MDRRIDNIDIPFLEDANILGKWVYADFVDGITEFSPGAQPHFPDPYLISIEFLPLGEVRIETKDGNIERTPFKWTNGYVLDTLEQTCSSYLLQDIDEREYMFLEWKSGDYIFNGLNPKYYVLKREAAQ
jgi:bla regulator protein BlaR1